jgi:tRNA(Ile)-lysidine synthase
MPASPKGSPNIKLLQIVERTIAAHDMFLNGDRVLVSVSGGPDSMALLHVLHRLAPRWALRLAVAHFNHGLRGPDAQRDADFTRQGAERLNLPFFTRREDVAAFRDRRRLSLEEAGRERRYAFCEHLRRQEGFDKIAIGHQADDNAELVLMNLLRGSGPDGLAGIPPVRDRIYVRPLIAVTRDDIMRFINHLGIAYVEDRSNADMRFTRNKIRHRLIPLLEKEYNPQLRHTLNRTAEILRLEDQWLRDILEDHFRKVIVVRQTRQLTYAISRLRRLHPALQHRLLRHGIRELKGDLRRIGHKHVRLAAALIDRPEPVARFDLPDRIQVQRAGAHLIITRHPDATPGARNRRVTQPPFSVKFILQAPGDRPCVMALEPFAQRIRYAAMPLARLPRGCTAGQDTAFFDMNKLTFPLVLRTVLPGDRFQPFGVQGSQKVSRFLINRKIPHAERKHVLVLVSAHIIVWVVGLRIAEHAKITPHTQQVLKMERLLA